MTDLAVFFPLLILGMVNSGHCVGMCGGIMGALTMSIPQHAKAKRMSLIFAYNLGRILSYGFIGFIAGFFAQQFVALGGEVVLRVIAGLLLITMGLYLADWWRGLTRLETVGRYLWVYIQPFSKALMPVDNMGKALLLGGLWGWLPCGLVYSALAVAMTQPSPAMAAAGMLAFGVGTLPAVVATGVAAQQLTAILQKRGLRRVLALLIILFGVWTLWGAFAHGQHHHRSDSVDHSAMHHEAISEEANNTSAPAESHEHHHH